MNYPSFNQWTSDHLAVMAPKEHVSNSQLNDLLGGRKFGVKKEDFGSAIIPIVPECNPEELRELEEYCKKRGIVGVNFNGMSPRAVLNMLRGKVEGTHQPQAKKGLLHG